MEFTLSVGAGAVLLAFIIRKRMENSFGSHDPADEMDVKGKVVIITGGSSGLGKETAFEMLSRGAHVILACRDTNKGQKAIDEILQRTNNGVIETLKLDLASFESIREFAKEVNGKFDQIDILINNAGVFIPLDKRIKTAEGFEINFGVNHLGHFLLTNLLLDKIKKAAPSRIVTVASTLSEKGELDFDDLNMEKVDPETVKSPREKTPYSNSKLANVMFSKHLAVKLSGTGVQTYALCPGWVKTDLGRDIDLTFWKKLLILPFAFLFMRSVHQGTETILHCSLSKQCGNETGKLYRNCDIWKSKSNLNDVLTKKLWDVSQELVKF